jgi:RimJ/RimL family protein N-acetyltransferase
MMPLNLLQGANVQLTALTSNDLPRIANWYQHTDFLRLLDARPAYPQTEAVLAQWLEERHKATDAFMFGVRLLENDELLGWVELDGILWTHQVSGIGIGIGNQTYWGKGYGSEAMQLALQFAFNELNLHRLQLTVFSYNDRAIALYEKLGFQREGVYREFLQRDGERHDMYLYGLLHREWQEHQFKKSKVKSQK